MRARYWLVPVLAAGIVLGLSVKVRGQTGGGETLPGMVQKSQALVVGEVTAIETLSEGFSEKWNRTVLQKRATVRIVRGINSSDASPFEGEQIALDFPAFKGEMAAGASVPEGAGFPKLEVKELCFFPIKHVVNSSSWQLSSEGDHAMMPAAAHPMGAYLKTENLPLGFVYQELAGAFVYGDYATMGRAGLFLETLGADPESPAEPLFALFRQEIGESSLREDPRWIHIAMATYCAVPLPRPALSDIYFGDKLPERKGLRLAALALRKAGKTDLDQKLALLLYNHQEDPGAAWSSATAIAQNYGDDPYLISMERDAIKNLKPGAFFVATYLIKDGKHPLAATAVQAAKDLVGPDSPFRHHPPADDPTCLLGQGIELLSKIGTDADFQYVMDQVDAARKDDRRGYQAILMAGGHVGDAAGAGPAATPASRLRLLKLFAAYLDDTAPMAVEGTGTGTDLRICDYAAMRVQEESHRDFGLKTGDMPEVRDAAIEKEKDWLKSQ